MSRGLGSSTLVLDILNVNAIVPLHPSNQHLFDVDVSIIHEARTLADTFTHCELSHLFSPAAWTFENPLRPATGSTSKSRATSASFSLPSYVGTAWGGVPVLYAAEDATPHPSFPTFLDTHFKAFGTAPAEGRPYTFDEFMTRGPIVPFLAKLGGVVKEPDLLKAKWLLSIPSGKSCQRLEYIDAGSILSRSIPKWQHIVHTAKMPNIKVVIKKSHHVQFQLIAPVKAGELLTMVFGCPTPDQDALKDSWPLARGHCPKRKGNPNTSSPSNPPKQPRLPDSSIPGLPSPLYGKGAVYCQHEHCRRPMEQRRADLGIFTCDLCLGPADCDETCIRLGGACFSRYNWQNLQSSAEECDVAYMLNPGDPSYSPTATAPSYTPLTKNPGGHDDKWVPTPGLTYSPNACGLSLPRGKVSSEPTASFAGLKLSGDKARRPWSQAVSHPSIPPNQPNNAGASTTRLILPAPSNRPRHPICAHENCFCPVTSRKAALGDLLCSECNDESWGATTCHHCDGKCESIEPLRQPNGARAKFTYAQECKPVYSWQDDIPEEQRDTACWHWGCPFSVKEAAANKGAKLCLQCIGSFKDSAECRLAGACAFNHSPSTQSPNNGLTPQTVAIDPRVASVHMAEEELGRLEVLPPPAVPSTRPTNPSLLRNMPAPPTKPSCNCLACKAAQELQAKWI